MAIYEAGLDVKTGELTLPAERFCALYVSNGGVGWAAAREAGYRDRNVACKLLKTQKVVDRIRELRRNEGERLMLEEAAIRDELKRVGMARLSDVAEYEGSGEVKIKPLKGMNRYGQASLQALKMTKETRRIGKEEIETVQVEVKQHNKNQALGVLARIVGEGRARESGKEDSVHKDEYDASKLTLEERVEFRRLLSKLRSKDEEVLQGIDVGVEGENEE